MTTPVASVNEAMHISFALSILKIMDLVKTFDIIQFDKLIATFVLNHRRFVKTRKAISRLEAAKNNKKVTLPPKAFEHPRNFKQQFHKHH